MTRLRLKSILGNTRGAAALEFALVAPAFIALVVGIAQMGLLFFANAGLHNALAEGARHATIFPRPTAAEVKTKINAGKFGLKTEGFEVPTVDYDTTASPNFAEIEMTYTTTLNFIVYQHPVTLTQSRRVYMQPLPES